MTRTVANTWWIFINRNSKNKDRERLEEGWVITMIKSPFF